MQVAVKLYRRTYFLECLQSVADFHKSKTKKILSIPKCWVGRFRSKLVKSNAPIVPPF